MATVNDLLPKIRQRLHDEDKLVYDDLELTGYINDAIDFLGSELLIIGDETLLKTILVNNSIEIPPDFVATCGQFPIYFENGYIYTDSGSVSIQYFSIPSSVSTVNDTIPLRNMWVPLLIQATVMYAQNTEEFQLKQDMELIKIKIANLSQMKVGVSNV
jgi:hypothetical protein